MAFPRSLIGRGALGAGAVLLVYGLGGAVLLPWLARAPAERAASQALHRRVSLGALHCNPFTLRLAVDDLRVAEADGRADFLRVGRIDVRASFASLLRRAPVIASVRVERPELHLQRLGPQHFSTDDILAALQAPAAGPAPAAPAGPARFSLSDVLLTDGRVLFDDLPSASHHELADLRLALPSVSTLDGTSSVSAHPELAGRLDGARVAVRAGLEPPLAPASGTAVAGRSASLQLDLDGLDLASWMGLVVGPGDPRLAAGHASLHAMVTARIPDAGDPQLQAQARLALDGIDLRDARGGPLLALDHVGLELRQASYPSGPLDVHLDLPAGGHLDARGTATFVPLDLDLALDASALDLAPWQSLAGDRLHARIASATARLQGHLQVSAGAQPDAAPRVRFRGDIGLPGFSLVGRDGGRDSGGEILRWGQLDLKGLDLATGPFALAVDQVALSDYAARIVLSPAGRMNVQDLYGAAPAAVAPASTSAPASVLTATPATNTATIAASPPVVAAAAPPGAPPSLSIGQILLRRGHVRFSDHYVQPNYNAELVDLGGTITGLSSRPSARARFDLQGRVNDAPLVIGGTTQPLAGPLFLDLQASVQGMDVVPFTPYSARYIGYRIDRGKLSFDVNYHVDHGRLSAANRLVLDQLQIGDPIPGAQVTSLPVRLAIALLQDRKGVIDIDLPVSGSLDAPDFSVAGVVFHALGNVIVKAAAAPFTLLSHLFGGHEDPTWVGFAPGSADLPNPVPAHLATVAQALRERPGLQLDLVGRGDAAIDGPALRALAGATRTANPAQASGEAAASVQAAGSVASPVPGAGAGAAAAPATAEALVPVTESDLVALGNRRSLAVRDWLVGQGVPTERIFLRAGRPGGGSDAAAPAARVDFEFR